MVESTVVAVPAAAPEAAITRWHPFTRVAFRFCFVYFSLFVLTTQMLEDLLVVPTWDVTAPEELRPIRDIYTWAAVHIFHVTHPLVISGSGSGDKTFDWVGAFCLLVVAAFVTFVWSVLDRRRAHYRSLNKWFRLFLRFALGTSLLEYGMLKAIPLQMPPPSLMRLVEPYGHFSPMGVLWASIGAAPGYERFAGCMELAAAVLLFIPGLSTLGAAVAFVDMVQVLMLNLTYDVPVKLFASHLVGLSLVLLAPELGRILDVFVFNRPAAASTQPPLVAGPTARRVLAIAQIVLGAYFVGMMYRTAQRSWTEYGGGAPKPPLYGIWNVDKILIDGVEHPPLLTDSTRWRRVIIQRPTAVAVQAMDDRFTFYSSQNDTAHKTLALKAGSAASSSSLFSYEQADADHLRLDGQMAGHHISAELRLYDTGNFLLVTRGFHWIQEYPFNQ